MLVCRGRSSLILASLEPVSVSTRGLPRVTVPAPADGLHDVDRLMADCVADFLDRDAVAAHGRDGGVATLVGVPAANASAVSSEPIAIAFARWRAQMSNMRSSKLPDKARAGQALTRAPVGPWF